MSSANFPSSDDPFHPLPTSGVSLPKTFLTEASHAFVKQHCSLPTLNHCLRSAAFALLALRRHPNLVGKAVDAELVVVAVFLHDMGWATTRSLLSADKRFEVDGANIARDFVRDRPPPPAAGAGAGAGAWDQHRLQLLWDAIALHTTPSIAAHKEPEVAAAQAGISADFFGPYTPPAGERVTVDEYREVVRAWPRAGFAQDLVGTMCYLCHEKAPTTYDNFVAEFGCRFGVDGKGTGAKEFEEVYRAKSGRLDLLLGGLAKCAELEEE